MNAITTVAPPQLAYAEMERLASDFAQSRLFGFKTKQEAMSIMMIAQAEGKHPATAARDYDVIQGRPAKKAEAMHRDFIAGGGKVQWHTLTDELADATFSHPQGGEVRIGWDMARALMAGLSKKENWAKYPRQMLRNRTLSEGVRTVWPGATSGMYEPGEVSDFTGKTIDGTAETDEHAVSDERAAINDAVPLKPAAASTPRAERKVDPTVYETPPKTVGKPRHSVAPPAGAPDADWRACLDWVAPAMARLRTRQHVVDVANGPTCSDIIAHGPGWAKAELDELLNENYRRFPEPEDEELPEVEIEGEHNVMAGD